MLPFSPVLLQSLGHVYGAYHSELNLPCWKQLNSRPRLPCKKKEKEPFRRKNKKALLSSITPCQCISTDAAHRSKSRHETIKPSMDTTIQVTQGKHQPHCAATPTPKRNSQFKASHLVKPNFTQYVIYSFSQCGTRVLQMPHFILYSSIACMALQPFFFL